MSVIFLLGPGFWREDAGASSAHAPLHVRKKIAETWRKDGHTVLLMEEVRDAEGETILQKFDRLLRQDVTHVVVYWPPLAKMATTYTELVLLCDREEFLKKRQIDLLLLHHVSVLSRSEDEFKVLERGDRSRYLEAVVKLGPRVVKWETEQNLHDKIRLLSAEF
jgi:hypothetical protein